MINSKLGGCHAECLCDIQGARKRRRARDPKSSAYRSVTAGRSDLKLVRGHLEIGPYVKGAGDRGSSSHAEGSTGQRVA